MPAESSAALSASATPHFLDGALRDRPLFVWRHSPPPQTRRRAGIVLCPPLGYEDLSAYRTWRLLAERLAALGFETLRVDYDGTGNSAGSYDDSGRIEAWLRSIAVAIIEARAVTDAHAVALIGLRTGALLALQAAADAGGIDRLAVGSIRIGAELRSRAQGVCGAQSAESCRRRCDRTGDQCRWPQVHMRDRRRPRTLDARRNQHVSGR